MSKKSLAFGLVAAAILFAPTTALADDQEQYNEQITEQNGAAVDYSITEQNSESRNSQEQIQENRRNRDRDRYYNRDRDRDRYYNRNRDRDRDLYEDDYYYR